MQICEHFRRLAPLTDLVTLIRSMTHDDPPQQCSHHPHRPVASGK
jgi:hypothetical protein